MYKVTLIAKCARSPQSEIPGRWGLLADTPVDGRAAIARFVGNHNLHGKCELEH